MRTRNRIFFNRYCFYIIKNVSHFSFFLAGEKSRSTRLKIFFRGFQKEELFYLFFDVFFRPLEPFTLVPLGPFVLLPVNVNFGIRFKK